MSDELIQRMLATEFGGMNEVMADLAADTGDRRWLDLSYRFEHKAVLDPFARVIGWLGLSALLMTAAGLYALISGRIVQRTREIGIRRALGASSTAIGRTVVAQVIVPLGAGTALGAACAWPVARAIVALEPTVLGAGSGTYGLAIGTLAVATALALAAPTAKALIISPTEALRSE